MRLLLFLVAALIVYGSCFPFELRADPVGPEEWGRFATSWFDSTSRGDALGNVALFVPYGFVGMFAFAGRRRFWITFASGFVLASAVQMLQLFLAERVATFIDVFFNMVGLIAGALLAVYRPRRFRIAFAPDQRVAIGLIGLWILARLMPLVPSIDFQLIKDSLKPLLLHPEIHWSKIAEGCLGWLVVAHLWQGLHARVWTERYLPLLMAAVFAGEVVVVANVVSASSVIGAATALLVWWTGLRTVRPVGRASLLAMLLAALVVVRGWAPFEVREQAAAFEWLPFADALRGSMVINATAWIEKLFWFGSLAWLLKERGMGLRLATGLAALLALAVEIGQIRFAHHTPAITDPLLALLAGFLVSIASRPQTPVSSGARG